MLNSVKHKKAEQDGCDDYFKDIDENSNPYVCLGSAYSVYAGLWSKGFRAAQRRTNALAAIVALNKEMGI